MKNVCLECGDPLVGRVDKKFCSDQCRNIYNNRLKQYSNNYIRRVNNILSKNRRILAKLNPSGKTTVHRNKLVEKGFNFSYFTNIYETKTGKQYYFVYEFAYLPLEKEYYALVMREEYVE